MRTIQFLPHSTILSFYSLQPHTPNAEIYHVWFASVEQKKICRALKTEKQNCLCYHQRRLESKQNKISIDMMHKVVILKTQR